MKAHDYRCECERCRAMIQAIIARSPDGSYFFTDKELLELAMRETETLTKKGRRTDESNY